MKRSGLVFLLTLTLYTFGLLASPYWLDSSEFAVAAFSLGVAHPPGHPLALLVGKLCTFFPFGSVALRVGFAAALATALAAVQVSRLATLVSRRVAGRADLCRFDQAGGAVSGLLFALSYGAGFSAVRPEVYGLSTLLCLSGVYAVAELQESGDRARLYVAALWFGLALCNHHLLALSVMVPALLLALFSLRRRAPLVASVLALLVVLGCLSIYLYLPLRALHHPPINWGVATTWPRFFWVVSGAAFQKSLHHAAPDAVGVSAALLGELNPIGLLAAVAGLYVLLRSAFTRSLGLLLLLAALADAAMPALVGFDADNPDAYGYLETAVALLAASTVALPSALAPLWRRRRKIYFAGVGGAAAAAITLSGLATLPRWWRPNERATEAVLGDFLRSTPPHGLLVSSYFQSIFALSYLQSVAGMRPDVTLLHRHFLPYPGYGEEFARQHPRLAPLLGDRDIRAEALAGAPSLIEYDLDLPATLVPAARVVPVAVPLDDPETRKFAGWQRLLELHRSCRLKDETASASATAAARELLGDSPELRDLVAHCRDANVATWRPGASPID